METIIELGIFREAISNTPVVILARLAISLAWIYALAVVWSKRHLPHANQALTGALAMVLSNSMTVFNIGVPYDVALFFVAMSQLILSIVFSQLFGMLSALRPEDIPEQRGEAVQIYLKVLLGLTSILVIAAFLQYALSQ